ncbi:Tc toxin subunit A-related protein [Trinickia symbiotica]|uniref:Tc toxin subunit A-related protein n=1 Tax=Trinickia symbiotica TaxID=863227 RepID=UPI00131A9FB9|nr:insecticidal toxin protein [Trinickia symbiotica]
MARGYQTYIGEGGWRPYPIYITLRNRSLTYQFRPHFHPYVPQLIQRLNQGGIDELLASDTLYLPQPNPPSGQSLQPLSAIPDSTRSTLATSLTATRPNNGPSIALTAGTPLTLPQGTSVTVKAGTLVGQPDGSTTTLGADATFTLPGYLPVAFSSGIQNAAGPGAFIVMDGTEVTITLPANANAVLAYDGSPVQLPAATAVAIRAGQPQPYFYVDDFGSRYNPDANSVQQPYPVKDLDFSTGGAYSIYNWELFFHAPLMIAIHLSQNQKFQDAQRWFHYIFNPTDNSAGPTPQRFWKVAPFQYDDVEQITQVLVNLARPQDPQLYADTVNSIAAWQENPFQPWVVAKFRPTAYMLKTVMAYLDNLIAWGDSLFQQYTIETINEATQLYVMAANILGPKPQAVPEKGSVKTLTYNDLRKDALDPFGDTMVEMEADIPFDITPPSGNGNEPNGTQILPSIGKTLYFCVPRNDKLLGYWDTVADRLFKIHNSLNLQGVFQRPPLFDPPIDPALLVRATAAGLDVNAVVSGINQPLPLVRFQFLVAKAAEICQEVKSLGAELLAAIEKGDNESISLLRSLHESAILGLTNVVKYTQWQEAIKATQALQLSLATAVQRYAYYQTLLGRTPSQISAGLPALDPLDTGGLANLNFTQSAATAEPLIALDPINAEIAKDPTAVSDGEIITLSTREVGELSKLADSHQSIQKAEDSEGTAANLGFIPDISVNVQPWGIGLSTSMGGTYAAKFPQASARGDRAAADGSSYEANQAAKLGAYARRQTEWTFQGNSAKSEINQIVKQIRGAQLREAIAANEYQNHQTAMANAQQIVDFLRGNDAGSIAPSNEKVPTKTTTIGFYAYLKRDVKSLYAKAFQLAFEVAKKAERALQNELGDPSQTYIQYNYLDGKEGLLAGEKLLFDVKAMEMAYHDLNQREYELTKHVSLRLIDPVALLTLRATGSCTFTMPEALFDMDGPGHYFRRIKSVAVTVPCVAGPYSSVNCMLSMQKSSIRTSADLAGHYARQGSNDPRFNDYYGSIPTIVTSTAQSDSGLFETNLRDERYLPFECAGVAESQWQLTIPSDIRQFDFDTITDVIIHLRYTAREGGQLLKAAALQNLQEQIDNASTVGSVCLFSLRHDFASEWAKFQSTSGFTLALTPELYPTWAEGIVGSAAVKGIDFFAEMSSHAATVVISDTHGHQDSLVRNPLMGSAMLTGSLNKIALPAAVTDNTHPPLSISFDNNAMDDLWIAIKWGG